MNNRTYKLIILVGIFLIGLSSNVSAQTENDETANVKKRAEELLQALREEKWNELSKFVVVVTLKKDEVTGKMIEVFQNVDNEEVKEKVIARFKRTYGKLKPGKTAGVRLDEKNKTIAHISYWHEDLDGFRMVLMNGEWYYKLEHLR